MNNILKILLLVFYLALASCRTEYYNYYSTQAVENSTQDAPVQEAGVKLKYQTVSYRRNDDAVVTVRIVSIVLSLVGIVTFVVTILCLKFCCPGCCSKVRPGRVIGQNMHSVPPPQATTFMPPPPPSYS